MGKFRYENRERSHRKRNYRKNSCSSESSSTRRHRRINKYSNRPRSNSCTPRNDTYSYSSSSSSNSHSSSSSQSSQTHKVPHYRFKKGERLYHRYKVMRIMGNGTFGRVLECRYMGKFYAVKVIKPVKRYIESAQTEKNIIKKINDKDGDDHYGIVRYVRSFYHNGHFCMVFRPLGKSLYDFIKMNNYKGFSMRLVQSFFEQILRSIGFLHRIGYTHTDLKPENILLETRRLYEIKSNSSNSKYCVPSRDKIRIIDFGGATKYNEYHSSIINTRQYRSPEVILQCCQWDQISDVWSIGCIVSQLYTGNLLFPTHEDEEHVAMIEKCCGNFPKQMIQRIPDQNPIRKMFQLDGVIYEKLSESQMRNVGELKTIERIFYHQPQLIDLLSKCLEIDPYRRITCEKALKHPFFSLRFEE